MSGSWLLVYAAVALAAAVVSAALLPLMYRLAHRTGMLDRPGRHKAHAAPTPLLGGGAVVGAFLLTVGLGWAALALAAAGALPALPEEVADEAGLVSKVTLPLAGLLGGAALMFALGTWDDRKGPEVRASTKLLGQVAAAGLFALCGGRLDVFPGDVADVAMAIIWVVGITNAVNFVDNMDGVAAGLVAVSSLCFLVVAAVQLQTFIAAALAALLGSTLAFLRWNFPPARMFLGNGGAYFLGYVLGALTVLESYVTKNSSSLFPIVMPLLVLALPVCDMASVVWIRWREGRPVYIGDRRHIAHRLVRLGLPVRGAVLLLYSHTLAVGIASTMLSQTSVRLNLLLLALAVLILVNLLLFLYFAERGRGQDGARQEHHSAAPG